MSEVLLQPKAKILVVDDELHCLENMQRILRYTKREVEYFQTPEEAIAAVETAPFDYALAFVDHQYKTKSGEPECRGPEIAEALKALNPMITVCIVSADESDEALQSWLSSSVDHYRYKPTRPRELEAYAEHHVCEYEQSFMPVNEVSAIKQSALALKLNKKLVVQSSLMEDCCAKALKFAKSELNVLLLGEPGTGKELIAEGIHSNSENKGAGIRLANCSSYKDNPGFMEEKLFGHKGMFKNAEGGTIVLDEVHCLGPEAQERLLVVLKEQARRFSRERSFRLIAISGPNLEELCKAGQFSTDLYYMLKGLDLTVPPLRKRGEDVTLLALHFLKKSRHSSSFPKRISKKAMDYLESHNWPGNVRELKQLMEKLSVIVDEAMITPKHLSGVMVKSSVLGHFSLDLAALEEEYKEKQKAFIVKALEESDNNLTIAAKRLGLGNKYSTLRSKIKQLQIKSLNFYQRKGLLTKFQRILQEA